MYHSCVISTQAQHNTCFIYIDTSDTNPKQHNERLVNIVIYVSHLT